MRAVSLFSGIGGLDLAAVAAGIDIAAHVEIDPFCRQVLEYHKNEYWKDTQLFADVRDFGEHSLTDRNIQLIYGGFPCQPFSISGSRKGKDDSRNMWGEFRRVISEYRPRAVLLENVPAICNPYQAERIVPSSGANRFTRIRRRRYTRPAYALTVIKDLSEMGYVCQWGIISARDAGAAHLRERWWLVGYAECGRHNRPQDQPQPYGNSIGNGARGEFGGDTEFHAIVAGGEVLGNAGSISERTQGFRQSSRSNRDGNTSRQWADPSTKVERDSLLLLESKRTLRESRMVGIDDGIPSWLDEYCRPALINELENCAQFPHEPPRTIAQKTPHRNDAIRGFGNAVFIPTALQLFRAIKRELDCETFETEVPRE